MNLVTNVLVSRFRSIHEGTLDTLQDFSVLAGLNNSGKSNFLRAINLFFTGAIEPGLALDFQRDFFRPELSQKKRKRIAVELSFALPTTFKFRSDLAYVGEFVGTAPTIRKEWNPADRAPAVFLNKSDKPLSVEEAQRIETFLRLISVRYIPNRVIPTELIAQEHQAIRDVLVRRLAKFKSQSTKLFNAIEKTSLELMTDVSALMKSASPDLTNVSLSTATSLADLAFRFGYLLSEGETQTSENEQGSGIQSLLMFRTLSLIDQDFFKQFGWKQAALWLVEEPESSLHTALEAQVAYFLAKLTTASGNRLQAIATTHSDLMIQYSNQSYLIRKEPFAVGKPELKTTCVQKEKRALLNDAAQFGISRWVNPILLHPLDMLVLVEGKYDLDFIGSANQALGLRQTYKVASLAALLGDAAKGGVDTLIDFIKRNSEAIKSRPSNARVVLLLDWDASGKLQALASAFKTTDPFTVFAWNEAEVNPSLDKTFRGVERYISNRLIIEASEQCGGVVAKRANGTYTVTPDDMNKLKQKVNSLVRGGLNSSDAAYAKPMLTRLQDLADSV